MAEQKLPKRKLHLNWDQDKSVWWVKKSFGFLPPKQEWTSIDLEEYLRLNPEIDIVARYI